MKDLTKTIKVPFLKTAGFKATIKRCNDAVHKAGVDFLNRTPDGKSYYAMSELTELTRTHAVYKITLVPETERMAKEQLNKKVRNA